MQLNASLQRFKGRGGEKKITVKYRFRFHGGEKMLSHFKSFNMYLFIVTPQTVPEIKRIKSETKCKQSRRLKKKNRIVAFEHFSLSLRTSKQKPKAI